MCQQRPGQQIAVVRRGLVDGTVLPRLADDGQRLHHQPHGVVRIFHGQLVPGSLLREECRQVDGLHTRLMLGIGDGLRDVFTVGQHGQIVLLAVGEAVAIGTDPTDEQRLLKRGTVDGKRGAGRLARLYGERNGLLADDALRGCIQQLEARMAADRFAGSVEDAGRQPGLIADTDEARHTRLYHDVLLGHRLGVDAAKQHIGGMGDTHEAPCRQALGQGELQHDRTVLVGGQRRIAESRLVQVLAQLHLLGGVRRLFFVALHAIAHHHLFLLSHGGYRRDCVGYHLLGFQELDSAIAGRNRHAAYTGAGAADVNVMPAIIRIDAAVERAVLQDRHRSLAERLQRHAVDAVPCAPIPEGMRLWQCADRAERPTVGIQGIEALVVEHGHQRGVGRRAVGLSHLQAPLFLLAGHQPVAEGLPRQLQLLVGHGAAQEALVLVAHAVLHPGVCDEQSVAVFFFIGKLAVDERTALLHGTALNQRVTGKEPIDDVHIGIRRAYLHGDGCTVGRELVVRHVVPVVGRGGGHLVAKCKDHERHVERVLLADGLEAVTARRALGREHGARHIGGALLPLATIHTVAHGACYLLAGGIAAAERHRRLPVAAHLLRQVAGQGRRLGA